MKIQWYVVYFRTRSKKKLIESLTRKKVENYFPVSRVVENWSIDNKGIDQPLFDNYIFVCTTEKQLVTVKKLPGVISLVYWLGKPVIISEAEINTIKRFLTDHVNVKIEKITLGNAVIKKVSTAVVEKESSFKIDQNIDIVLPSLGYRITAGVETSTIRIILPDTTAHKSNSGSSKIFNPVPNFNNF